ncbi:hypothetical protein CJ483_22775 [Bacillus sp. PK3_68]|nr:hypothetical protein CJ483_22775 [Bacillus sp. PK3_68]
MDRVYILYTEFFTWLIQKKTNGLPDSPSSATTAEKNGYETAITITRTVTMINIAIILFIRTHGLKKNLQSMLSPLILEFLFLQNTF